MTKKGIVHFSTKINAKWMDDVVAKNVKIRVFQIWWPIRIFLWTRQRVEIIERRQKFNPQILSWYGFSFHVLSKRDYACKILHIIWTEMVLFISCMFSFVNDQMTLLYKILCIPMVLFWNEFSYVDSNVLFRFEWFFKNYAMKLFDISMNFLSI